MAYQGIWAGRDQPGILAVRRGYIPTPAEIGARQDRKPDAERGAHETDEAHQHAGVECQQPLVRQHMTVDRNAQSEHHEGEETQAYGDLTPPYPSAANPPHHGNGRQAPIRDERQPESKDEPTVVVHGCEVRTGYFLAILVRSARESTGLTAPAARARKVPRRPVTVRALQPRIGYYSLAGWCGRGRGAEAWVAGLICRDPAP